MSDQDTTRTFRPHAPPSQPASSWYAGDSSAPALPPPPPVPTPRRRGVRMTRRRLLVGAGAVGLGAVALTSGIIYARENGLRLPFQTVTPAQNTQISWLLRRAGFGARASEISEYAALGYAGAVERLLSFNVPDDLDTRLSSLSLDLTTIQDQQRWWALRMIYSKNPLQEKMTLFWHGLLTSSFTKVGGMSGYGYMINQNQFLRGHALDTFDNLLLGITSDPAMMWWLDLRLSRKNAPNENFARELMELFTLGVNSGYTQTDVHDAARALTGWTLTNTGKAAYVPAQHDDGQKTLLGHTGDLNYQDVIRIVAAHPAAGPYLSKRIFTFFVHENPSDAEVQPMVDAYYSSGHSVKAIMRAMFNSPAFFAASAYRSRIKSPSEFVVGVIRQMEIETDGQAVAPEIAIMGQILLDPPNVAGWPGDVTSAAWINTGTWLNRINFLNAVLAGGGTKGGATALLQLMQATLTQNNLATPNDVTQHFAGLLLDGQLASAELSAVQSFLANSTGGGTLNLTKGTIAVNYLRDLLYLFMGSPDYQLN